MGRRCSCATLVVHTRAGRSIRHRFVQVDDGLIVMLRRHRELYGNVGNRLRPSDDNPDGTAALSRVAQIGASPFGVRIIIAPLKQSVVQPG
jgi:hypothetical protein